MTSGDASGLSPSDDVAVVGVIEARVPTAWFLGKPELGSFGDPLGTVTTSLVASATVFDVTVTGQGGAVYRPFPGAVGKSAIGNGFVFGAGVEVGVITDLVAVAEVAGAVVETQTLGSENFKCLSSSAPA